MAGRAVEAVGRKRRYISTAGQSKGREGRERGTKEIEEGREEKRGKIFKRKGWKGRLIMIMGVGDRREVKEGYS